MTRINSSIPVQCLTDEHLLAEHREIKRLPACLRKAMMSGSVKRIPDTFRLGTGHVLFFLDKMLFTKKRCKEIYDEALHRGFHIIDYSSNWDMVPSQYMNDYHPSADDKALVMQRIKERIENSRKKSWRYHKKPISKNEAMHILER